MHLRKSLRKVAASIILLCLAVSLPVRAQSAAWEVIYLYRDDAVESNQAYQLAGLLAVGSAEPRPLRRFPIDGIAVPWEMRPPSVLSPDGTRLALIQWDEKQGGALLINLKSGESKALLGIQVTGLFDTTILGWTADGANLIVYYAGSTEGRVLLYDLASAALTPLLTLQDTIPDLRQEMLAPDNTHIVYCNVEGNRGCAGYAIRRLDGAAGKVFTLPSGMVCSGYPALKWSPDSRKVALSCLIGDRPGLALLDAVSGAVTRYPTSGEVNDVAWAANSTRLLLDLCAGNYVNADDPDCGALQWLNVMSGTLTAGPTLERTEARRIYWLGDTLLLNESSGDGQEATLYFYDMLTRQSKQFSRSSSSYEDASFIVLGIRASTQR